MPRVPDLLLTAVERPTGWHWVTSTPDGQVLLFNHEPFPTATMAIGNGEYIHRRFEREGRDPYEGAI